MKDLGTSKQDFRDANSPRQKIHEYLAFLNELSKESLAALQHARL